MRRIVSLLLILVLVLSSTAMIFASESTSADEGSYISIPIYNSIEEAEAALLATQNIPAPAAAGDEGGEDYCLISPFIVRKQADGTECELMIKIEGTVQVQAFRFKKLVVESEYIGINYLKITPASSSQTYVTYDFGSLTSGYKTIYEEFDIPTTESRVRVKTTGLGIYRNLTFEWLACQYQIGGWWTIQ